jgi:hypothetical protein
MRTKVGDNNIIRHPMCVKNRRQMKFWWEKEWDYGDENRASLIICNRDERNLPSRYVLESLWRKQISSPNVFEK